MTSKWIRIGIAAVIALLVVVFLRRGSSGWTLTIEANQLKGTPWSTFKLDARVQPTRSLEGWTYHWTADGAPFGGDGPSQAWRSHAVGTHHIAVVVTSDKDANKTAELDLEVREVAITLDLKGVPPAPKVDPSVHDVPFGVDDIEVEKNEVCVGEPSLIRVKANSKAGRPGDLVTVISGLEGSSGAFMRLDGEPGVRMVTVQLRDPALPNKYAEEEVFVELKDCFAPASMIVENRPDPAIADDYEFRAKLFKLERGKPLQPLATAASFTWDFEDGTKQTTKDPTLTHVFPSELLRPSDEHTHTYVVKVAALDESGAVLARAYSTVFFHNLRRESRDKLGLIELIAHFQDAATIVGNVRSMPVTLDNIDKTETVTLTDIAVRSLDCDGKTSVTTNVPVASIFANGTLAPASSVAGVMTFNGGTGSKVCRLFVTITGTSTPGHLDATGAFAMTVGEAFRPQITNPAKLEMIRKITVLLGKPGFTQEDVQRLENEGKIPRGALSDDPPAP